MRHITIMRFKPEHAVCDRTQDVVYRCAGLVRCLGHAGGTYG